MNVAKGQLNLHLLFDYASKIPTKFLIKYNNKIMHKQRNKDFQSYSGEDIIEKLRLNTNKVKNGRLSVFL